MPATTTAESNGAGIGDGNEIALPSSRVPTGVGRRAAGFVAVLLLLALLKIGLDYLGVTSLIAQGAGKALQRLMSGVH